MSLYNLDNFIYTLFMSSSPLYFDDSADDSPAAVKRLVWGKYVNNGQTCVAPDYVLCSRKVQNSLIKQLPLAIKEFYSDDPKTHKDYGRIININHFKCVNNFNI